MQEVVKYHNCFVCGDENQSGLRARFFVDGDRVVSHLVASDDFEGYRGIYHGGVISAMLDEVMIKAILANDVYAVTAEMTVRFLKPVMTGSKLTFIGKVVSSRARMYETEGEVVDDGGVCYATATGKYLKARPELEAKLKESVE